MAYLPVEDSATIIHHRLYALGKYLTARQQQIVADKATCRTFGREVSKYFLAKVGAT